MVDIICVAAISSASWLISLACPRSAARRHLVLLSGLIACLAIPFALAARNATNWKLLTIHTPASEVIEDPASDTSGSLDPDERVSPELSSTGAPITMPASAPAVEYSGPVSPSRREPWRAVTTAQIGFTIYLLVAISLLIRLLYGLAVVLRVKRRATPIDIVENDIQLLESPVSTPMAVGFGKPAILLPHGFQQAVSPAEMHDVLEHELEHLRRGDHWIMLLQRLAAAVYWPALTIHLLNRSLNRAREELCDNAVLIGKDFHSYCRTLLTVAQCVDRRLRLHWAPSIAGKGDLERRVASILDQHADRRTAVSRMGRSMAVIALLGSFLLLVTTRLEAEAKEPPKDAGPSSDTPTAASKITWTGVPLVSRDNPILHRGVVLGPDGKPVAGASIYGASTIELLTLADADKVAPDDLGSVRAVTDAEGRFEFEAKDLSWVTPAGERKRWETLLVATHEGLVPAWIETYGEDRSFRSHWHPHPSTPVALRMRPAASLSGTLALQGGAPLANAKIRLTGMMAPWDYDLTRHIDQEERKPLGLFSGVDYAASLYRPSVLPRLKTETQTDSEGRFELPGLPEGFIAQIEVTHPKAVTSEYRAAIRSIEPVFRKSFAGPAETVPTLFGSGFHAELSEGIVLKGQVVSAEWGDKTVIPRVTVARANQNSADGFYGQRFTTDADGRFEITGLAPQPEGYELAFVGSFAAPYRDTRQRVVPGQDARVELYPAVRYRLRLTDPEGQPVDRSVYSVEVQERPGTVRRAPKSRFNEAVKVAPGVYEGMVPMGPAAVVVKRGKKTDRPAAVEPKEFFAPGRTDWTREEERYAYGDSWRIAYVATSTTDQLASDWNPTLDQSELAAVVLTKAYKKDEILELTAVVQTDPPVEVTLVDEADQPVHLARVERQITRYNADKLPSKFSIYGLHPNRPELLVFYHDERKLIGTLSTTWTGEPLRVVMKPAATIIGRLVDQSGNPTDEFGLRIIGPGALPDAFVAGKGKNKSETPGERSGEFREVAPSGLELRGEFLRKSPDALTRPSAGRAFGPMVPKPGEVIELGDLKVP